MRNHLLFSANIFHLSKVWYCKTILKTTFGGVWCKCYLSELPSIEIVGSLGEVFNGNLIHPFVSSITKYILVSIQHLKIRPQALGNSFQSTDSSQCYYHRDSRSTLNWSQFPCCDVKFSWKRLMVSNNYLSHTSSHLSFCSHLY